MTIDHQRMYRDIVVKLAKIDKSQDALSKELEISRSTIWRLSKSKEISTNNFFKIIEWIDQGFERYLIGYVNPSNKSKYL
ncbi:hypothetical protein [Thalassobellus suaedae]|uniref:HTH cro/C1-type domain-containing protein n=1 Tax=Thalassobellus suaedae TaxID=3074124 RepID=A0ABY9XVN2_9FLAO|nr:hypothetical protein RHP51_04795 [Flavobacteriaceae bacterium HL-DH14]